MAVVSEPVVSMIMLSKPKLPIFTLIILAISMFSIPFLYGFSATNRNTIITPGGGTTPCSFDIFVDGSNYDAKNCLTGDISYINSDPTILLQTVNDNCPANGCLIFVEHVAYPLT